MQLAVPLVVTGVGWLVAVGVGFRIGRPVVMAVHVAALTVAAAFCAGAVATAMLGARRGRGDVIGFLAGLVVRLLVAAIGLLAAATWFSGDVRNDLLLVGAGLYLTALAADTGVAYRATLGQEGDGSRT